MFWSLTRSSIFCACSSAVLLKKTSRAFSLSRLFVSLFNVVFANLVRSNLRDVLRLRPFGGANKYYDVPKKIKRGCLGRADYHWGEVKAVDPKGCHSGHLKN